MPDKTTRLIKLLILMVLTSLALAGCGKFGEKFANQEPNIVITSYEGYDDSELLADFADTEFLFQQKIFWHATDQDGVITGFAYRVINQNGEPIATPGNHFVDFTGDYTPQEVVERFGKGWVLHYKPGADQSLPLDHPEARKSIWTTAKYAVINFPAADANGNPLTTESTFEVIAVDNRGGLTPVAQNYPKRSAAWRKFNASSQRPTCIVSTTKGNPGGGEVGSGLRLKFTISDTDPFIDSAPSKFEFKMMKIDADSTVIAGTSTDWIDTSSSNHDSNIDEFLITRHTDPALTFDVENGVTKTRTRIESRVYDLSGVVSQETRNSLLFFAVKTGLAPKTLIYPQKVYALGHNHYTDYYDEEDIEIYPFTITGGQQRFATFFFKDIENKYTAINSSNIKVWLRWGWHGEYAKIYANGSFSYDDSPYDKKVDTVLDRKTSKNYYSEITHFDIRWNGEPYNYPPFANSHVTDSDGKEWLRIPLYSPLGQSLVLTTLPSGEHTFEVRCVDLQGEVDPEPEVFKFTLHDPIEPENRSGILVIDDDTHHAQLSPDATVLERYQNMLSDYTGTKKFISHSRTAGNNGDTYMDTASRHLATTDLQKYKLVIYHSDHPGNAGSLQYEYDGLTLYMLSGGNLLISHSSQLSPNLGEFVKQRKKTLFGYLGLEFRNPPTATMAGQTKTYFQSAIGQQGYPNIQLQYEAANSASFSQITNNQEGLHNLSYFPFKSSTADVIYRMGLKPVDYPVNPPSQVDFNLYNNQPIALRNVNRDSHCYLFGFPLSYMNPPDAKAMINKVLAEVM